MGCANRLYGGENMEAKRVACLYRVSTKGQVDKNDIPMQKAACRNFILQKGWRLVKEYQEQGVSGYRKTLEERDVLQQIQQDALAKMFDVLLVFMFDRLGRRDDETPFIVEWFVRHGIEVWSVIEGQQRFDDHIDKLINYLRFWQSSGESYKTSIRVNESHKQLTEQGIYRGGNPPYGYKLVPSGRVNKKGKELLTLAIDEEQAKIVRLIFDLTYERHWGGGMIARYLNEQGYRTPSNNTWTSRQVNFILRNPIYKGYLVYGRRISTPDNRVISQSQDKWVMSSKIPELVIVDEEKWNAVREIKNQKHPKNRKKEQKGNVVINAGSPLLLVGMIRCGHCGSPLTTTYNNRKRVNADGTIRKEIRPVYRCSGKALYKTKCEGQTLYAKKKIESIVLDEIKIYLKRLAQIDLKHEIEKLQKKLLSETQQKLDKLQKENENNYEELAVLKKEISKSLMGKSAFSPEMLSELINEKEQEIENINKQIQELEKELQSNKLEINSIKELQETIPRWEEEFRNADINKQKVMLRAIIDEVVVYRDKVEINIKMRLQQFLQAFNNDSPDDDGGGGGCENGMHREYESPINTSLNFVLEKFVQRYYNK